MPSGLGVVTAPRGAGTKEPEMTKLSDTQLVMLNNAAQRVDRGIVIPETLRGGARDKVLNSLLARRLIRDVPRTGDLVAWREKDGRKHARSEERRVGKECRSRWSPD